MQNQLHRLSRELRDMVYLETVFNVYGTGYDNAQCLGIIPLLATNFKTVVLGDCLHLAIRQTDKTTQNEVDNVISHSSTVMLIIHEPWPHTDMRTTVPPLLQRLSTLANLNFVLNASITGQSSDMTWLLSLKNLKRVVVGVRQTYKPPLRSNSYILQGLVWSIYAHLAQYVEILFNTEEDGSDGTYVPQSELEIVANKVKLLHGSMVSTNEVVTAVRTVTWRLCHSQQGSWVERAFRYDKKKLYNIFSTSLLPVWLSIMAGTFDFFGLPHELGDMVYKILIHQGSNDFSTMTTKPKGLNLMRFCVTTSCKFQLHFATDVALRQTCTTIRDEFDEAIKCTSLMLCLIGFYNHSSQFQVGPTLTELPIVFNNTIRRLTIMISLDNDAITKSYGWAWLTKMKALEIVDVKIVDHKFKPAVLTRSSYLLHGLIAHLLPYIAKDVVVIWGALSDTNVQMVKPAEMKAVAATFMHLQGTKVPAAMIEESGEVSNADA